MLAWFLTSLTGNLWLGGGLAVVVMAALGWVQDAGLWKPLRRRRLSLTQMMIVSIGLSIALQYVVQLWIGAGTVRIDKSNPTTVTIFGVTLTIQSYVAMGIAIVAIAAVGLGLMYTRFGRATRAVSDNPALASASGIDVDKVIRGVWILASGLAGLAGVLLGLVLNGIGWETGGQLLLLLFAAVTLGGLGTAFGAFAGAMVIGLIVELTNIWLPGDLKYARRSHCSSSSCCSAAGHLRPRRASRLRRGHGLLDHAAAAAHRDRDRTDHRRVRHRGDRPEHPLRIHGPHEHGQAGFMLLGAYGFAITVINGGGFWLGVLVAIVPASCSRSCSASRPCACAATTSRSSRSVRRRSCAWSDACPPSPA
ncbi:hypothetical protein GCM10023065_30920 [Microbacterium laevaniformans]